MQYDVDTPKAYLDSLASDWRKQTLQALRALILEQDAELQEGIQYKMLCYALRGRSVFHLNAQRAYVSLYVGDIKRIDPDMTLLDGLNVGKGCIRFTKSKNVQATRIDEFIAKAVALAAQGVDLDC
ncbi:MAG: DUF1801 domain-containing protein [Pseudomonadota bacterium]